MVWLDTLPTDWWTKYSSMFTSSELIHQINVELLFIVRSLILETRTYARACKRNHLLANDFKNALDFRNIHYVETKNQENKTILSLSSLIKQTDQLENPINKITITFHWLSIDGEQPIIEDNPLPCFTNESYLQKNRQQIITKQIKDECPLIEKLFQLSNSVLEKNTQFEDHVHPLTKNNLAIKPNHSQNLSNMRRSYKNQSNSLLQSAISLSLGHELSTEQQFYFKFLTEELFHTTDGQIYENTHIFSSDISLQPLLPRLLLFIDKGIQMNIHLHDLNFIIRFLFMLKMLTMNDYLSFEKYLHTIIPSLLTCLLCIFDTTKTNKFPLIPDQHYSNTYSLIWLIREQASDLLLYFQNKYSTISYFTERILSIIRTNLINNSLNNTFSIVYSSIRTLLLIDIDMTVDLVKNILTNNYIESDFDLDYIEQKLLFKQKLDYLFQKHSLSCELYIQ